MYQRPTEGESVALTQAPYMVRWSNIEEMYGFYGIPEVTWPVTRCYRVTGPPHRWLGIGQPWLRIQHAAQAGHVNVQRVHRARRRIFAPDAIDELAAGDGLVRPQREQAEYRLALRPA